MYLLFYNLNYTLINKRLKNIIKNQTILCKINTNNTNIIHCFKFILLKVDTTFRLHDIKLGQPNTTLYVLSSSASMLLQSLPIQMLNRVKYSIQHEVISKLK